MMTTGSKNHFGIEIQLCDKVDDWIYGTFAFWVDGRRLGDPDDNYVDLRGCINWLRDLAINRLDRFEPGLFEMPILDLWQRLVDPILGLNSARAEVYSKTYARFHISHVGMSSFDQYVVLLVTDKVGNERIVWQHKNQDILEGFFGPGQIETAALEMVRLFESEQLLLDSDKC